MNRTLLRLTVLLSAAIASPCEAQIRVVTYNTLDKPVGATEEAQLDLIFEAIAATDRNGIAKRVDIVSLQEQEVINNGSNTAENVAARLNAIHGVTTYEARVDGNGNDRIGVVFDSSTVSLIQNNTLPGDPRTTLRSRFRPVGYSSLDADFYVHGMHLKAGDTSSDRDRRLDTINSLKNAAEPLADVLESAGFAVNYLYVGDLNIGSSAEAAYQSLTDPGSAQGFDPIQLGPWPRSFQAEHMTQSTRTSGSGGGAGGGLDDRFDLQIVTADVLDGEGFSYIGPTSSGLSGLEHSYQAFGNDGICTDCSINATYTNRSQSPAVLDALHDFSDHLPVVADYQVPAVLGYEIDLESIPLTLAVDEEFSLELAVQNAAQVVAAAGADELDYTVALSGDLFAEPGDALAGTLDALADAALHDILFDTSTPGMRTGTLTLASTSKAAQNALIEVPIAFEVVGAALLAGDYNDDGFVDAADYTVWRDAADSGGLLTSNETASPGVADSEDYVAWRDHYGAAAPTTTIPEPTTLLVACTALCAAARRR